jgi:hypothetical protein
MTISRVSVSRATASPIVTGHHVGWPGKAKQFLRASESDRRKEDRATLPRFLIKSQSERRRNVRAYHGRNDCPSQVPPPSPVARRLTPVALPLRQSRPRCLPPLPSIFPLLWYITYIHWWFLHAIPFVLELQNFFSIYSTIFIPY